MAEPTEEEIRVAKIDKELEKWDALGIDPTNWTPRGGILQLLVRHEALSDYLVERFEIDESDLQKRTQEILLMRLTAIREELEPEIRRAKLQAIKDGRLKRMH